MTGAEVLKTVDWAGKYIPIVPVYGDEVIDEDGRRHFRSLIRDAKSAQQMFNYWRTTTTELVALAPKAPWIGRGEARSTSIPIGTRPTPPATPSSNMRRARRRRSASRSPACPAGALQEALNANDDMKAIIGIYDASLGARSNETSGRAIMARQREGDVSTFHFIDNLSRAIRHGGRILLDLIPKVYSTERMVRMLGEDLAPADGADRADRAAGHRAGRTRAGGSSAASSTSPPANTISRVALRPVLHDAGARRRRLQMEAFIQKVPQAAPLIGDLYAEALDWPLADRIGERLKLLLPPQLQEGGGGRTPMPPQVQQQMQQGLQLIQQQGAQLQQAQQRIQALEQAAQAKARELELKARELDIKTLRSGDRADRGGAAELREGAGGGGAGLGSRAKS